MANSGGWQLPSHSGEVGCLLSKPVFCGPAGSPRGAISLIETGLDGHPDHSALDFLLKIASV
jgi:hypothetical protein